MKEDFLVADMISNIMDFTRPFGWYAIGCCELLHSDICLIEQPKKGEANKAKGVQL